MNVEQAQIIAIAMLTAPTLSAVFRARVKMATQEMVPCVTMLMNVRLDWIIAMPTQPALTPLEASNAIVIPDIKVRICHFHSQIKQKLKMWCIRRVCFKRKRKVEVQWRP